MPSMILAFFLPDFAVVAVSETAGALVVEACATPTQRSCPTCGRLSMRVHSRYARRVRDLPLVDRAVHLHLHLRRFFCDDDDCPRRTFVERLPDLAPLRARRTVRLTRSLRDIGFATGGEAGARLATRLRMPTSGDTVLRLLRATPPPDAPPPTAIGIDDFALRKGRVYGTIVVDLERRTPIDLLPDRTPETVATRLRALPELAVVARDRSPEYARGITAGAPQATQVADRFHLLTSLREAVERYVHRVRPELRQALIGPEAAAPPTAAALDAPPGPHYDPGPARRQIQAAKHAERERRFQHVKEAQARGLNQRQIVREAGLSLETVRRWVVADVLPPERRGYRRDGKVDPYGSYLLRRLGEGCTNQTLLWQEITAHGFVGTRSLVSKWIRAHRDGAAAPSAEPRAKLPGAQHLAWLVLRATEPDRTEEQRALWERLRQHAGLAWLQETVAQFATMVRERRHADLEAWLTACHTGPIPELHNFALGLERDGAAVRAALSLPWSNGPTEGLVNKLKMIKRSAYGRMKLDLLRQRVLHAA
jgi:transposase